MRLALLTHEPFHPPSGGGSAAAMYLVEALVSRGHEVHVFGPQIAEVAAVERRFGIQFHPFTGWPMGRTTPLRTFKYLAYPTALARLVSRTIEAGLRFDLLVAQHSISAVAAARLKRRHGIPVAFNLLDCLTGFLETWPPYLMPRFAARALVNYELSLPRRAPADAVLTVSDALRERVVARGYPREKALAIYYGYDHDLFVPPPTADRPREPRPPRIVMHGSFDHHHLGTIARRAVIEVARQRPDLRFRFVGPRTASLQKFLRDVRAAAPGFAAEETGFVPYAEIPRLLGEADLGITPYEPSTGTHCAFVAKTVEYLALGLPVVCTPLESAQRYYHGLEGIRFSQADGADFGAAVLDWLRRTPEERRRAVEPARQKIRAELSWSTICHRAAEFLEQRCGAAVAAS